MAIDCRELTVDEQLALAGALSDSLEGRAVALVKDESIVFDIFRKPEPQRTEVEAVVEKFLSRRRDSRYYSAEWDGVSLVVHSADPLARSRGRREHTLPDNLLKCPSCAFITPYKELYDAHVKTHALGTPR